MGGKIVTLTDGSKLEVKISFATLYYIQKSNIGKMMEKTKGRNRTDTEDMEISARMLYALLKSSGKNVTFDEALQLIPPDPEDIKMIIEDFSEKMEDFKKKQEAKQNAKRFQSK